MKTDFDEIAAQSYESECNKTLGETSNVHNTSKRRMRPNGPTTSTLSPVVVCTGETRLSFLVRFRYVLIRIGALRWDRDSRPSTPDKFRRAGQSSKRRRMPRPSSTPTS